MTTQSKHSFLSGDENREALDQALSKQPWQKPEFIILVRDKTEAAKSYFATETINNLTGPS